MSTSPLHDSDYLWCGILILNHFFFGKSSIFEGKLAPAVLLPTEIRSGGVPGPHQKLSSSAVGFFQVPIGPYPTTRVKPPWLWPSDGPSVELKIDLQTWAPQQLGKFGGFRYRKFRKWKNMGKKQTPGKTKKMPICGHFWQRIFFWKERFRFDPKSLVWNRWFLKIFSILWSMRSASNDADRADLKPASNENPLAANFLFKGLWWHCYPAGRIC